MVEYDYSDSVVFITGGARGIGRATALEFARSGADVAVIDLPEDTEHDPEYTLGDKTKASEVAESVEEMGSSGLSVAADISKEDDVEYAVERTLDEFGKIDVLVNNAAAFPVSYLLEMEEETWDMVLDTNLKGTWLCSKHVGRHMVDNGGGGEIVNVASHAGLKGIPKGLGHYVASKHGVIGLTKTLALELAEDNINVNSVCPGAVGSEGIDEFVTTYGEESLIEDGIELAGPFNVFEAGRQIPPEEISNAIMWLASGSTPNVTGTALPVDAGYTAK